MKTLSDLLRNTLQLGYVTDDLDAAAEFLESKLGTVRCVKSYRSSLGRPLGDANASSAQTPVVDGPHIVVDGTLADEWVIDVALVNAGPTNLEIIRPVSGRVDLYRNGIRPGAAATFHHAGFRVDDFDEASAIVEKSGRSWAQYGATGGVRFGYLDLTAELGHFVEVMELDENGASVFATLENASNAVA